MFSGFEVFEGIIYVALVFAWGVGGYRCGFITLFESFQGFLLHSRSVSLPFGLRATGWLL